HTSNFTDLETVGCDDHHTVQKIAYSLCSALRSQWSWRTIEVRPHQRQSNGKRLSAHRGNDRAVGRLREEAGRYERMAPNERHGGSTRTQQGEMRMVNAVQCMRCILAKT